VSGSAMMTSAMPDPSRRELLCRMGGGFGGLALAALAGPAATGAGGKPPHGRARAKRVIFLFLNGGLSHVDTFDPKPMLARHHGAPYPGGNPMTERKTGNLMRSPFEFRRSGRSGIEVSEIFPLTGAAIDRICVIRSMHTDFPIHEQSLFLMNCGDVQPGRPSMGSWLTYGLGSESRNLPGYVVLCPGVPVVGPPLWNSAFLPATHQGTHIANNEKDPRKLIAFLRNSRLTAVEQRRQLDFLQQLNRMHRDSRGGDPQLDAGIEAMETAFRMQTEAMEVFDLGRESRATLDLYGDGDFARGCLTARRLAERGVRMVQIYFGNGQPWDNHDDILVHRRLAQQADRPIAALLGDLEARGLLEETLVMVGSEFGRTPTVEVSASVKTQNGRDHNPYGFSVLLAGGGVKGGMTYGATDEFGFRAVEKPVHVHDLHATVLHLMGLDHKRLTYPYSGREFRLTDVGGEVIGGILA